VRTLVCFHAHPDDEVLGTGGTIARASGEGHRVVLVVATNGEHGETPDDLGPGETLADRRRAETEASARILGIDRVVWLGYADSGMTGWPQNADPDNFMNADVDDVAARLAAVLREEDAEVLTIYDWHGNYGHPDHIAVHRVGVAAAALVPEVRVLEATMNRDAFVRAMNALRDAGVGPIGPDGETIEEFDPNGPADDGNPMGMTEAEITLAVDVTPFVGAKRKAMRAHASQIDDTSWFLEMPEDAMVSSFGTEWYIEHDRRPPYRTGWIFADG
jgi:LmbE family N-acetylglucosaminyl deacetylase